MRWLTVLLLLLALSSAAANRRERLRERRKSILQRETDALELLHDSLQPVGEVAARVAGGRRYVDVVQLPTADTCASSWTTTAAGETRAYYEAQHA
jgi:hypothetical protein